MTVQEYISAGFEISAQIKQTAITRAENDVINSYIIPIVGADYVADNLKNEIMTLTFCLLLRRNVVKTRFGAEQKNNQYATVMNVESKELNNQIAGYAMPVIQSLIESTESKTKPKTVRDIIDCGYYFI